jgi:hypothetical protein
MTPNSLSQIDSPLIESAAMTVPLAALAVMIAGESLSSDYFPLLGRLCGAEKVRSGESERMIRG